MTTEGTIRLLLAERTATARRTHRGRPAFVYFFAYQATVFG
jgi:hypothetical protein